MMEISHTKPREDEVYEKEHQKKRQRSGKTKAARFFLSKPDYPPVISGLRIFFQNFHINPIYEINPDKTAQYR